MGFISLTLGYHLGLYLTPNLETIVLIRQQCNIPHWEIIKLIYPIEKSLKKQKVSLLLQGKQVEV
jgi:hypothetical protein